MMPLQFIYSQTAGRVVFGAGALEHLGRELDLLGVRRALLVCTPGQRVKVEDIARVIGERSAGVHAKAMMHVSVEVAGAARVEAKRVGADALVAYGGGSAIGLAKAVALDAGLPILAIPTTYSGSEMTAIYGLTEAGLKRTGRDPRVQPKTVIYDPQLTLALPVLISATSGMNAIAHAVEALYAPEANPVTSMLAEEGMRALAAGLPRVVKAPGDLDARSDCLYGAWLCGAVLGVASVALHHKLCHTLGGSFNLAHAQTNAVVLPHAVAYNYPATPEAMRRVERSLDATHAAQGLYDLVQSLGAPMALKDIGMQEADLDRAAELATQTPYPNPRPVEYASIRKLLDDAFHGRRPQSQ